MQDVDSLGGVDKDMLCDDRPTTGGAREGEGEPGRWHIRERVPREEAGEVFEDM